MTVQSKLVFGAAALFLWGCSTTTAPMPDKGGLPSSDSKPVCSNALADIRDDHIAARVSQCDVRSDSAFEIRIKPEHPTDPQGKAINDSAWYGFRVDPKSDGRLQVRLKYENGKHRYHPKISYDGTNWDRLPESKTSTIDENEVNLSLELDNRAFFVSAQEIFSPKAHDSWTRKMAGDSRVTQSHIGLSREGRPIHMLDVQTEPDKKKPYVVWVGRQHPPEVTGALALMPFTETVLADTKLANEFLDEFNLLIVPITAIGVLSPSLKRRRFWAR